MPSLALLCPLSLCPFASECTNAPSQASAATRMCALLRRYLSLYIPLQLDSTATAAAAAAAAALRATARQ